MQIIPVGPHAALVEVTDTAEALALAQWARAERLAVDVVPGAATVLLDGLAEPHGLEAALQGWSPDATEASSAEVELEVRYDGPDLEAVAALWRCSPEEVVERHRGTTFVSAFCGFAPGFAYLSGLDVSVPRLATPRTRVPAGSVGLAGTWCGVYPRASPGGWQLIGRTDAALWDVGRDEPALLAPGTRVRFREAG